jgi:hypothetical protein
MERSVYFVTRINVKVDLFYFMLVYLMDTFAPKHLVRVRARNDMCGVGNWLDDRVELAIRERNIIHNNISSSNVNRVRGDHLWVDFIAKHRLADTLEEMKYSEFVSVNLEPGLPPKNCTIIYVDLASSAGPRGSTVTLMWSGSVIFLYETVIEYWD